MYRYSARAVDLLLWVRYNAGLVVGRILMKVIRHNLMGGVSPGLNIKSMS